MLVAEHTDEGAVGLVLNRQAPLSVDEAAPSLAGLVPPGTPLFLGGPVQPEQAVIVAEFEHPGQAGTLIMGSIGFPNRGVEADDLVGIRRARVFAGYAGWGPGQLEAEIDESSWILELALPEDVFVEDPERLWSAVLRRKGGKFKILSTMPWDPSTN
ncbi:MAG: YqgE/AlgH family protein [Actinomycetota bacterium]|nr:YqgE/AlgH family protein [Actinomycetota bacterium]